MKKLPIGIQTFKDIITNNLLYVDKTEILYKLITNGSRYFLARPRRFGKSLTISTLESIFNGEKELFKNLAISNTDYNWPIYSVLYFDMSGKKVNTAQELEERLKKVIKTNATRYSIKLDWNQDSEYLLEDLVIELAEKGKIVLLIDEYDHLINDHIDDPQFADKLNDKLSSFYSGIKRLDRYLQFVFVTGIGKFIKSISLSPLNNLNDISMSLEYATMIGYTEKELIENFKDYIEEMAKNNNKSFNDMTDTLRYWYDGYRFHNNSDPVYSPQTLMKALQEKELKEYWFATATPSFLMKIVKKFDYPVFKLENAKTSDADLEPGYVEKLTLDSILYQTGYLTLKTDKNKIPGLYYLKYPNEEVTQAFMYHIAAELSKTDISDVLILANELIQAVKNNDPERFLTLIYSHIASVPYQLLEKSEKYYHIIVYTLLRPWVDEKTIRIVPEDITNIGRIDITILTKETIFIIELKSQKTAREALDQIVDQEYYAKYLADKRKKVLIGMTFDLEKRNLKKPWLMKELE